jgi:hypothetical protein
LVVARIKYNLDEANDVKAVCKAWDIWDLHFKRSEVGCLLTCGPSEDGRVTRAAFFATPLYTIHRIEDVESLLKQVRDKSAI